MLSLCPRPDCSVTVCTPCCDHQRAWLSPSADSLWAERAQPNRSSTELAEALAWDSCLWRLEQLVEGSGPLFRDGSQTPLEGGAFYYRKLRSRHAMFITLLENGMWALQECLLQSIFPRPQSLLRSRPHVSPPCFVASVPGPSFSVGR